jgi:hypothetical protein
MVAEKQILRPLFQLFLVGLFDASAMILLGFMLEKMADYMPSIQRLDFLIEHSVIVIETFLNDLGASYFTSRATMDTLTANSIFTNVGLTPDGDVWWDGMTNEPPAELVDWTGQQWTPDCGRKVR